MKFVYRTDSVEGAEEIRMLLEKSGIPASISNKQFSQLYPFLLPHQLGVFIYIKAQFNDAISLIHNNNHIVRTQIDVDEFYKTLESKNHKNAIYDATNKIILHLASLADC